MELINGVVIARNNNINKKKILQVSAIKVIDPMKMYGNTGTMRIK